MAHSTRVKSNDAVVPEVVVLRLPQYLRVLSQLLHAGAEVVSSQQLGEALQMTPAQIRKDLSYFGRFGKQGRGYNTPHLLAELRQILGLDQEWPTALVGVGRLGRAIIEYPGFDPEGFKLVAAFDVNPQMVGQRVGRLIVRGMPEMLQVLQEMGIRIGIVAVPGQHAQHVIEQLIAGGVKAILNYAPVSPQAPADVKVRSVDPVLALQSMTYHLRSSTSVPLASRTLTR